MGKIIDITVPFSTDLPLWPGDPAPSMDYMKCMAGGYRCNVTRLETGVHFGTHLDAPCHFIEGKKVVDELDLNVLVGTCTLIEIPDVQKIEVADLEACNIKKGTERLLIKTYNSHYWSQPAHEFRKDYSAITADAAAWMVDFGIKLIGIDYLSIHLLMISVYNSPSFAGRGGYNCRALDLRFAEPGNYRLTCLPMKLVGADGAPVRAGEKN